MSPSSSAEIPSRSAGPPADVLRRLRALMPEDVLRSALHDDAALDRDALLRELAGRVLTAALEGEMTEHLGYARGEVPPFGATEDNARNGHLVKVVVTPLGDAVVRTPRDRSTTFRPRVIVKRQTRVSKLDERVVGLYAGELDVHAIQSQLAELYAPETLRNGMIASITGAAIDDIRAWRGRRLAQVYPVVHLEPIEIRTHRDLDVRPRPGCLAVGVTGLGDRETLGLWWQDSETPASWRLILHDLRRRGVGEIVLCRIERPGGVGDAFGSVFPGTWVQPRRPVRPVRSRSAAGGAPVVGR